MDTIKEYRYLLHPRLKLLVTSREHGIPPTFRNVCHYMTLNIGDFVISKLSWKDASLISRRRPSWCPSWSGKLIITLLEDRSSGLFVYCHTIFGARFFERTARSYPSRKKATRSMDFISIFCQIYRSNTPVTRNSLAMC